MTFKSHERPIGLALAAAITALIGLAGDAAAQRRDEDRESRRPPAEAALRRPPAGGDWQHLGVITHTPAIERKAIPVGREFGRFGRIGLHVTDGSAEIIEVNVVYGNDTNETFAVNEILSSDGRTRAFDLTGEGRFIREVTVVYKPIRDARIELIADPLRLSRPGPRWQQLGCQRVGLFDRDDVIQVGGIDGRFSLLKLTADGGNVRLDKIKIVYGNGTSDLVNVRSVIPDGAATRPLELTGGRRRAIERIELFYIPALVPSDHRATVCAFGS